MVIVNGSPKMAYGSGALARQNRDYVIGLLCVVMLLQSIGLVSVLLFRSPENSRSSAVLAPAKIVSGVAGRLTDRVGALRASGGGTSSDRRMPQYELALNLELIPGIDDVLSEADSFSINGSKSFVVFVAASDGVTKAVVGMGRSDVAGGIGAALVNAEIEVRRLWQLKGLEGTKPKYIKVDVVSSVKDLEDFNVKKDKVNTSGVGVRGIAFDWEKGWAFTPDEVMAGTLLDAKHHHVRLENVVQAAANRGGIESVAFPWPDDEDIREEDTITVQTFKTTSVFIDMLPETDESDAKLVPVFRGHQKFDAADDEARYDELMESAKLAGEYLVDKVDEDGVFLYSYLPKSDSQMDMAKYSITRHAGTVYSMALLYEQTGKTDKKLIDAAKRALDYLISDKASAMVEAPYTGKKSMCAIDKRHADKWCCKLGSNGLTVLALAKYVEVVGDDGDKYTEAARLYAKWIEGAQRKDGSFVHKQEFPSGELDLKKYCRYYPGEAIYGLTQLYKLDSDERWLDVAEKAGKQMIKDTKDDPTNDHWLLYGLRELHAVRPHHDQVEHSMALTKFLHSEHKDGSEKVHDLAGAYDHDESICSTATKTEGMCAAYELAKANGLEDDAARILVDTELGALYQMRAQFRPEGTLHLPNPRKAIGGFKANLENWEVRIDYVQHSLSGLLCLAKALANEGRRDDL